MLYCARQFPFAAGIFSSLVLFGLHADASVAKPATHSAVQDPSEIKPPEDPAVPDRKPFLVVKDEAAFIDRVCKQIEVAATANGLPPAFLAKLIWKESRFDPNAISPMGAEGIAQFMPATAAKKGLKNSFEPMAAILASAELIARYFKSYGNLGLAAAAYNAGEDRVAAWRAGRSGLPWETINYVFSITGHPAREWRQKDVPKVLFVLDEARPFQAACSEMPLFRAPLQPRFANTYFNRGLALANARDYHGAITKYTIAIRLKPNFPDAYNNRGVAYRRIDDFESAIANYDVAIRLNPKYAAAYNNRGYAYRKLGRFAEAINDYDKAVKLQPGYITALFNRGFAEAELGRYKEAIHDYSKVLKRQPKHAVALYNRALAYLEISNLNEAHRDFDKAIAANAQFAKAYYQRALLMLRLGKTQRALADYQRSAALEPAFGHEQYKKSFE